MKTITDNALFCTWIIDYWAVLVAELTRVSLAVDTSGRLRIMSSRWNTIFQPHPALDKRGYLRSGTDNYFVHLYRPQFFCLFGGHELLVASLPDTCALIRRRTGVTPVVSRVKLCAICFSCWALKLKNGSIRVFAERTRCTR